METAEIKPNDSLNLAIQPFPIDFEYYDYHVMLYIKKHPEYEAIEAMIKKAGKKSPLISVTITLHDQSRIYLANYKLIHCGIAASKRQVFQTDINFIIAREDAKPHVTLKFVTHKGENVVFDFYSVSNTEEYLGGLEYPREPSINCLFPIMFRKSSTLASKKSSVAIDGIRYKIPVKVWIPLLFKGMKGHFSNSFYIAAIRQASESLYLLKTPSRLEIGQKWVYKLNSQNLTYEIVSMKGTILAIRSENTFILAEASTQVFNIKKIILYSGKQDDKSSVFSLTFRPALPVFSPQQKLQHSAHFTISIDMNDILITGTARVNCEDNALKLLLEPQNSKLSKKERIYTVIRHLGNIFIFNTETNG